MSKGKAQIVGWKYSLGLDTKFCHGPVDAIEAISFGDREAWSGNMTTSGDIYVNAPELFGGDQREGGVFGTIHVAMGEASQGQNPYLVSQLGPDVPAYRGVLGLIFNKFNIGSNNPYIKKLAVRVRRITQGWSTGAAWYDTKANIAGAMNGAHIIYQCLTDTEWGMGYPVSSIDDAQFRLAADMLFSESFGLCLEWKQQAKIEDFIGDVCDHIGGALRADPLTGKFQLKLFRDDYVIGTLQTFDENNSTLDSFERPNWGETTNEIVVTYTEMSSGQAKVTAVQDLANVAIQNSIVSAPREYPGIVSDDVAGRVAIRDLRAVSTPLARMSIVANRKNINLNIGDLAKLNDANLGIVGMPIRILNISYGTLTDGLIKIDAAEDIYGMPSTAYVKPQGVEWSDPAVAPVPTTNGRGLEIPYWEVHRASSTADFETLDNMSAFIGAYAIAPAAGMFSFNLGIRQSDGTYPASEGAEYSPTCLTTSGISYDNVTVGYASEVNLGSVELGSYGYIDEECVVITGINTLTKILTIKRGMMDTVPAVHNTGARVWFSEDYTASSLTEYLQGDTLQLKLLTVSALGALPEGLAPIITKPLVGRFGKPYAPGRVRINGEEYPDVCYDNIVLTWAHRDRTAQTASTLVDQYAGSIGPEAGTTYNIRLYKQVSGALLDSFVGLSGLAYSASLPVGSYFVRIEIESVCGGRVSFQKHSIITLLIRPTMTLITEDGNRLMLESSLSQYITE